MMEQGERTMVAEDIFMPLPRFRVRTLMIAVAMLGGWLAMLRTYPLFTGALLFTVLPVLFAEGMLNQAGARGMLLWTCVSGLVALALSLLA